MAHAVGFACPHMAGRGMVRNAACVRGGALSVVVHSTTAAMAAREHHDCDDVDGVEQQDDDGDGRTLESHRSRCHARDEWMAAIGGAGDCAELTLAALAAQGCMRVSRGMTEPMRWCGNSGCALQQQRNCSALNMSEYPHMLCELGVPVKCCASDLYSIGWCLGSVHKMSAERPMDSCLIIDPALDVRDADAVIWRGECLFAMPGDRLSSWCSDTLPTNTTHARDPEETYLSAAMHAALGCLVMQVRLRVVEKGGVRWVPCTDGATIAWATRPHGEGSVACRGHAQVCTISAAAGSLLPVVSWDGEEGGCGAGRSHRHLLDKDCEGTSVPVTESIDSGRGTPPKDVDLAAPQKNPSPEERQSPQMLRQATG
ncbi:surface protease GP63 [Trypanosoma cruzi]|uniref:Leishmanolysin-like peptidase n=1 Tax=Trypanosoma cruzi TaxID=5693 RepID=A0A7J6XKW4_TRYCR|nr:surface protease GP63 [Trypanosoma cruzi]KAF5215159.1 surface protease GP63 [Trypanosoma cruzi]